jgi:cytochrome c553
MLMGWRSRLRRRDGHRKMNNCATLLPIKSASANTCKQGGPTARNPGVERIFTELLMKSLFLGIALLLALAGCGERKEATVPATAAKAPAGDIEAGKRLAERSCKACHGLDGKGVGPGIPNLAAQRERYLLASLNEYKDGKRHHSGLRELATKMSAADMRDIAAYYAAQPPVKETAGADVKQSSPYELGKKLAAGCAHCHGEDGNAKTPGTPTLAGQQPVYLVVAIHEYHRGDRAIGSMQSMMSDSHRVELENLAVYFSTQTPVQRAAPKRGDPAAGEALSTACGGCHGAHGVSRDAQTPSLAGQDFDYLVKATKAYWTVRKNWGMQRYVAGLSEQDVDNIVAYYTSQAPRAAERMPAPTQELAAKCDRCHDDDSNPANVAPKMRGQDKDYLTMALRNYRDAGDRESSTMHRMSFPYSNAMIESVANWYASQPAK